MGEVSLLREQFQQFHGLLEGTMEDVTSEQAHWTPPGKANPLGATYAHIAVSEDATINGILRGAAPLAMGSWAGQTGISEPPPSGTGQSWDQWARQVRVDLAALRRYAKAVYAATDEFLATLADADLDRTLDLSTLGLGQQSVRRLIGVTLWNGGAHCGEISCLKGLQGARGYPM